MDATTADPRGGLWAVVLAGGDGRRLQDLVRNGSGRTVPKQFCSFRSDRSLLGETLLRARRFAPVHRVIVVVQGAHREHWEPELADWPRHHVVVQPSNRGTAAGLLAALLRIERHAPDACVLVLPSDHHVENELAFTRSVGELVAEAERWSRRVVLMGVAPDEPDTGYGWIVPGPTEGGASAGVRAFVEKPSRPLAERLMAGGALWNSFVLAGRLPAWLALYDRALPRLHWLLSFGSRLGVPDEQWARAIDPELPTCDVSRDVLEPCAAELRVTRSWPMGWSDLGTPERLRRCVQRRRPDERSGPRSPGAWQEPPAAHRRVGRPESLVSLDAACMEAAAP